MSRLALAAGSREHIENLRGSPGVLPTIGLGVGLAIALALAAAGLTRFRRVLVGLTGASLGLVLGVTLVPAGGWGNFAVEAGALRSIAVNLRPRTGDLTAWLSAGDGPLNVVLFVPLGLFLSLLLRRPLRAGLAAVGLSAAIECYQASLTTRVGSFADVVANGLGAAAGAAAALVLMAAVPRLRGRGRPRRSALIRPPGSGAGGSSGSRNRPAPGR